MLGSPRLHLASAGSTNDRARDLAVGGAPHGAVVTTWNQTAGRGRQGRDWVVPPGQTIAVSIVLRDHDELLSLRAGLAVADVAGPTARVKWPNDVLADGRKVAGVLVERRPQAGWSVLGVGINAALDTGALPPALRAVAGTLGFSPGQLEEVLGRFFTALRARLAAPADATIAALRERDSLRGSHVVWDGGSGEATGIDPAGRLLVRHADGETVALDSGEVHLGSAPRS